MRNHAISLTALFGSATLLYLGHSGEEPWRKRGGNGGWGSWDEVRVAAADREKWKGSERP